MKNKFYDLYKTIGLISVFPISIYVILLIPSTILFFLTWLLAPFQPEKFRDLEITA